MTSEDLSSLTLALSLFSVGFLVIGPNILAIMGLSMDQGRRAGATLALGVGVGSGVWASLTVLGLASLLTAYASAMIALKLFGAAYLSWMAYRALRAAFQGASAPQPLPSTRGNLFLRGMLIQLTNPKAALQWIAIVSLGIGPHAPWALGLTLIVSATCLSILGHLAYALAFSTGPVVRAYAHARAWIQGALGLFFGYAAFRLATSKVL